MGKWTIRMSRRSGVWYAYPPYGMPIGFVSWRKAFDYAYWKSSRAMNEVP